jgi:hypothetical protein
MKTKLLAMMLLAGGSMFAQTRFSVGVGVGGYAPDAYGVAPCAPGYVWADGYCVADYGPNVFVGGYWNSPYRGGYRIAPRFDNRFHDRDGRENFNNRGFEHNRGQSFSQNRNAGGDHANRGGSHGSRGR